MLRRYLTRRAKHVKRIEELPGGVTANGGAAPRLHVAPLVSPVSDANPAVARHSDRRWGSVILTAAAIVCANALGSMASPAATFWSSALLGSILFFGIVMLGLLGLLGLRLVRAILFAPTDTPSRRALELLSTLLQR